MSAEFWNSRYSETGFAYGDQPNVFFREQLSRITPGTLLLPGEGEGRNAVHAARNGWSVTAFDQSDQGRKKALSLAHRHTVHIDYHLSSWESFSPPHLHVDVSALIFVHLPPDQRPLFHQKIASLIVPGGLVIVEGFSVDQVQYSSGGPKDPAMLFSEQNIREDWIGWEIVLLERTVVTLQEGPYHQGPASVIRFLGKKKGS